MKRIMVAALAFSLLSLLTALVQPLHAQAPVSPATAATDALSQQAVVTTGSEPEQIDEGEIVRVNTTLVTVPIKVMDSKGKYVPDLRQEDFRIYEDGVEQQIAHFASMEEPFTVALLLDTSGSTRPYLKKIQEAAIAFIEQLRPEDRVMVIAFDDEIKPLSEATNDHQALSEVISGTRTGDGTRLYDVVDFVLNQRLSGISGRKAVVLFTDGADTKSQHASHASSVHTAEVSAALIYPIMYSQPLFDGRCPKAPAYLRELAERTGARSHLACETRELKRAFARIAQELRQQYSLSYYPKTAAREGQRCQIRVSVNQTNAVVRARDSYIYDPPGSMARTAR